MRGTEPVASARVPARGLAVVSAVLWFGAATACSPQPTGEEAVGRMLDALGSERAREGVRSLRTIAEGSGPNGLFVTSITSIRPDSVYFHQQSGLGTTEIWSTPERTWGGSNGEAYAEFGPEVRDFVRGHEFHLLLLDMPRRFSEFAMDGEDEVNGSACLRVTMTGQSGGEASVCIGKDNSLPAELRLDPVEADGPIRIEFADWRLVDGINLFHSFTLIEGADNVFTYKYVEISANNFGQDIEISPPTLPPRRQPAGES